MIVNVTLTIKPSNHLTIKQSLQIHNNLNHYKCVEDFLLDDSFCEWIQSGKVKHHVFWTNWQKNNSDKLKILEEASQFVLRLQFNKKEFTEAEINRELGILLPTLPSTSTQVQPKTTFYKWAIAASLAVLLTAGWVILHFLGASLVVHQTAYGEIKEIQLADDTKVVLQANSTLSVPRQWKANEDRIVRLEGEAFFDVSSASNSTFIVQGEAFQVEVLGTEFNILSRKETKRIALQEGKIRFISANQSLELAPDELLTYQAKAQQFIKSNTKAHTHTMWTKKVLSLDRMNLQELIRIIKDNYGYAVQTNLKDTNISRSVIGSIPIEGLEDLLVIIREGYNLEVIKKEQQIILLAN